MRLAGSTCQDHPPS